MLADGDGLGQAILRELLVVGALCCCHKFLKNGNFSLSLGLQFGNTSGLSLWRFIASHRVERVLSYECAQESVIHRGHVCLAHQL